MPSVENALLISKVIEINLTTLNSHFSLILHLQLACSKYHICASFISVIFSNIIFISEHEFRWLIDEKCHFFFYRFLFDTTTIISLHWNQNTFIPFFEGRIYVPFFYHKRMLFLVRFRRKSNQLSPSAFSAKKYGWTEKQSAGHSTKTGAKCWWSDWKVFSAVNNTVDWFM